MIAINLRYVTVRKDRKGVRYYWQRRGHKLVRLDGDPNSPEFARTVHELNAAADSSRQERREEVNALPSDSLGYLIHQYQASPEFEEKRGSTKKQYRQVHNYLKKKYGTLRYRAITPNVVFKIRDSLRKSPWQANAVIRQVRILLGFAKSRGWVKENPALRPKLLATPPRKQMWNEEAQTLFLEHADQTTRTMFFLGLYTAQRESDCLGMRWDSIADGKLVLHQAKGDALVKFRVHKLLVAHLNMLQRDTTHIVCGEDKKPLTRDSFQKRWKAVMTKAGIKDLQFRDLRRTGMVQMAKAGVTVPQIASVSGHSIESTQRIIDTYIPRNSDLADIAIGKWEQNAS